MSQLPSMMHGRVLLLAVLLAPTFALAQPPATRRPPPATPWQAAPLDPRALDDVTAFGRLAGYVRWFHPAREALAVDWDAFTVRGVAAVERAPGADSLASALRALFVPIAPAVTIAVGAQSPESVVASRPDSAVAYWRHVGMGVPGSRSTVYYSLRLSAPTAGGVPDSVPDPRAPLRVALPGGVYAVVPLALFEPLPARLTDRFLRASVPDTTRRVVGYADRATRLAAVITLWNAMRHFYPYFDVVNVDWNAELPRRLREAAAAPNAAAFDTTMRRMAEALHDGHAVVRMPNAPLRLPVNALLEQAEGKVVVVHAELDAAKQLRRGDELVTVNGAPIAQALAAREALVSGSPQWKRWRALAELARVTPGVLQTWKVRGADGTVREARIAPEGVVPPPEPRPEKVATLRPGIVYVDLTRVSDAELAAALPTMRAARGLVFDVRGYPSAAQSWPRLLAFLGRSPMRTALFETPIVTRPDGEGMRFQDVGWRLPAIADSLTARVAFLTDGRAISQAETLLGIVEHYKLGAIVGEATAGTNGNVDPFTLPGGAEVYWTGMRVRKQDGARHHLVGIQPTVPASRTVAGIRAGRDELLERAVELVSK